MVYPYSAAFYTFILLITTFLAVLEELVDKRLKGIIVVSIILILALSAGVRGAAVGRDTMAYMNIIESCRGGYSGSVNHHVEKGFVMLIKSILFVHDDPQFVLFIIALIINTLIISRIYSVRNKISFPFSVFSYVALYYLATYSGIRQWIAISVVFFGTKYVFDHKYIKFSIFLLIATAVHNSAVVAFLYIPLDMFFLDRSKVKYKKLFKASIILSPIIICLFFIIIAKSGMADKYNHLLSDDYKSYKLGLSIFAKTGLTILIIMFIKSKDYRFEDKSFYKKVLLIYLVGLGINFSGYFYKNIFRIGWYFIIYEVIFFSMVAKTKKSKCLLRYMIIFIIVYLFYRGLSGSDVSQMPYIPYWQRY